MQTARRRISSRGGLVSLISAAALVLLIAVLAYRTWMAYGRGNEQLEITQEVVSGTDALLSALTDAETGQRGFLLTGEDRYLEPYRKALAELPAILNGLSNATLLKRLDQTQRVSRLRSLSQSKLDELQQTIDLRRNRGLDVALAVVLTDRGKAEMDEIRAICADIQSVANRRLKVFSDSAQSSANQLGLIGTLGSAAILLLLLFSTVTIHRATRRRQELIEQLQESEERVTEGRDWLHTTLSSIGDGVIATDSEGRIEFLNVVAQTLTGWTQSEAAGKPLEQVFVIQNEETGETVESPVSKALREGRIVGLANHTRLVTRDNRQVPIDDSAAPIRDAAGRVTGVVLVFRDVTSRKEAEQAAQRSVEQFRIMADNAPVLIWMAGLDGQHTWFNKPWLAFVGRALEFELGNGWTENVHPEDLDSYREAYRAAFNRRLPFTIEYRLKRHDGSYRWILESGTPLRDAAGQFTGYIGGCIDIHERKELEEALRNSEETYRAIGESINYGAWICAPDGRNTYASESFLRLVGLTQEQCSDFGWGSALHPDDAEHTLAAWKECVNVGGAWNIEHRFRGTDGRYHWILARGVPVRDERGEIVRWAGINLDIDQVKAVENSLRASERELRAANEALLRANEDLNQFAFAASHDLQEPLRMITSYSQLLVKSHREGPDDEAAACVGFITEGTERMRELLTDLLAYTRLNADGQESLAQIHLDGILQKALENLKAAIEQSGAVVTSDPLPVIRGQEAHFIQLFQNLIENAIKYRGSEPPRIHVSVERTDGDWRLAVADNGMGIAPEYHQRIFGVFKRLHGRAIPGTGIGLALCQRVVERYGGRIWVDSQIDRGAKFYFTLPAMDGSPA